MEMGTCVRALMKEGEVLVTVVNKQKEEGKVSVVVVRKRGRGLDLMEEGLLTVATSSRRSCSSSSNSRSRSSSSSNSRSRQCRQCRR
jgi:hypothetical protein